MQQVTARLRVEPLLFLHTIESPRRLDSRTCEIGEILQLNAASHNSS
jgi:hypothetical protein